MSDDIKEKKNTIDSVCRVLDTMKTVAKALDKLSDDERRQVLRQIWQMYFLGTFETPVIVPPPWNSPPYQVQPNPVPWPGLGTGVSVYACPTDYLYKTAGQTVVTAGISAIGGSSKSSDSTMLLQESDDSKHSR
jgi:hypothetical protein